MSTLATVQSGASLPVLVRSAAEKLAAAETAAEVLDARHMASAAYDVAKSAARIAKAKAAHDEIITTVYRAQADALEIESAAKRRLADEYDAAQERGEVKANGGNRTVPLPNSDDLGLSRKDIHEARLVRDAERDDPGIVRRTLDELVEAGQEPTKAAVRKAITEPQQPLVSDDSLWLWGRLRDFDKKGIAHTDPATLLRGMSAPMRADVARLAPLVREFLEELEIACEPA